MKNSPGAEHDRELRERERKHGTTRDGTNMRQRGTGRASHNAGRDKPGPSNSAKSVYAQCLWLFATDCLFFFGIAGTFLTHTDLQILILIKLISAPPSPGQTRAVVPSLVVESTIGAVMLIPVRWGGHLLVWDLATFNADWSATICAIQEKKERVSLIKHYC